MAASNSQHEASLGCDQMSQSFSPACRSNSCNCHHSPIPALYPGPHSPQPLRRVSLCPSGSGISGDTESEGKVKSI